MSSVAIWLSQLNAVVMSERIVEDPHTLISIEETFQSTHDTRLIGAQLGRHELWAKWLDGQDVFVNATKPEITFGRGNQARVWVKVQQICAANIVISLPDSHISVATYLVRSQIEKDTLQRWLDIAAEGWDQLTKARLSLCGHGIRPEYPVSLYLELSDYRSPLENLRDQIEDIVKYLEEADLEPDIVPPHHISIYACMQVRRLAECARWGLNVTRTGFQVLASPAEAGSAIVAAANRSDRIG